MKKLTFLLPLAVAAMVSCSNSDEVFESAPQLRNTELKLFPQIQGNTRGVVETTASLSEFRLIPNGTFATTAAGDAAAYSTPMDVIKSGSVWTLGQTLYWGDGGETATFRAFSPKDASYDAGKITFEVESSPAAQKDLIVAFNSGTKSDFAGGVPLHFQHALSQIIVNATYANDADNTLLATYPELTVKVKAVQFKNVDKNGTLTLPTTSTVSGFTAAWALSGVNTASFVSTRSADALLGASTTVIDNSVADGPMLLLPQEQTATADLSIASPTGSYLMVQVDIDYAELQGEAGSKCFDFYPKRASGTGDQEAGEGSFAWIAVPVNIDWKAGYKYTYTLNFSNIACGKLPFDETAKAPEGVNAGDPIVKGVKTPVTFLVTVESEWTEQNVTPAL